MAQIAQKRNTCAIVHCEDVQTSGSPSCVIVHSSGQNRDAQPQTILQHIIYLVTHSSKYKYKLFFLDRYPPFSKVIPSSGKSKTYGDAFDARNQSLIFWKRISLRTSLKMDYCHLTIAALFAFILSFSSQEFVSAFLKFCNFQVLHINVGCSQFSALPVINCPVPVEFLFLVLR